MARAIWKGSISFGLVHIPVGLFSAEKTNDLSFRQLDRRNLSPVGYRKYNKATGEEVESDVIVKGYEYESGHYVVLSDEDLLRANPEKTQTVEITDFVDLEDIEPVFYDKPYYLAPTGKNAKGYALLREALKRTRKVGIAKVVIRSREYLSAVVPQGNVLVLEILRYADEIRATDDLEVPSEDLQALGVNDREIEMAERLVEGMTAEWTPDKYHDTYREDLMGLIQGRIDSGQTNEPDESPVPEVGEARGDVIDIMSLLKRSVEATTGGAKDTDADEADEAERPAARAAKPAAAKAAAAPKPAAKAAAKPRKPAAASKPSPRSAAPAKPRASSSKKRKAA
ncbi:Ku protein [Longimicrobium sp.]|jgi:DNA end-binding protein Ku|uniref:non-homologous end joining protein Ku n=1 Tax=Longimicrobium sp. TaxID=2029185 RepID=UPI002F92D779